MDLNFELILTLLFLFCGACWLVNRRLSKNDESALGFIASLAPILGLNVLRSFVEPFQIPSRSMVPTLLAGDYILVNKWIYGIRLPAVRTRIFSVSSPKRGR